MTQSLKIAQITDTHLFERKSSLHCGANVYQNLIDVLAHITQEEKPDIIVFTGDLTQDHTDTSYQRFVEAFAEQNVTTPVYFIAGNHDEYRQLNQYLSAAPFNPQKVIENDHWQVLLVNSKSETPSGYISDSTLTELAKHINTEKQQLIMMHHHPINVGYAIDKHGLQNKSTFWQHITPYNSIVALACGHVHNDIALFPQDTGYAIPLFACPATSIQFDKTQEKSACSGLGAGYRIFELFNNKTFTTHTHFITSRNA